MSDIKVAVAIPSGDQVAIGFAFDLAQMIGSTVATRNDIDVRLTNIQSSVLHKSRRDLVRLALKHDCTHLLFLDSDMRFPRHTLLRLLSHGEPIVGVNYVTRRPPTLPVTFRNDDNPNDRVYTEVESTGLEEVASTGLGVCLFDLDLFRHLSEPWFDFVWEGDDLHLVGEDVYLFRKLRQELGAKVLIDHDLSKEVLHVGSHDYGLHDALAARELAKTA